MMERRKLEQADNSLQWLVVKAGESWQLLVEKEGGCHLIVGRLILLELILLLLIHVLKTVYISKRVHSCELIGIIFIYFWHIYQWIIWLYLWKTFEGV